MKIDIGDKISYYEEGRNSYYFTADGCIIGEVIAIHDKNEFTIQSRGGQHLCFIDRGKIKQLSPKEFDRLYRPSIEPVEKPERKKVSKPKRSFLTMTFLSYARVQPNTKKVRAKEIFANYNKFGRKVVLDQFVVDLKMTPASASTYYYNFKSGTW